MDFVQYKFYFFSLFFLIAILFSVMINFLILRFSSNLGMRNIDANKNQIRWATSTKPSLGGFSFYIVFLISVAMLGVFPVMEEVAFNKQLVGLLVASSLGFLLGLADDAYNTNPLVKFIGQFTCANILVATQYEIQITPYSEFNYFITVLWVIGLMNSINMLDNMDAITASTSVSILLGAIGLLILDQSLMQDQYLVIILGGLGALIGFLFFNWNPSKMYMGDTGSQFLGVFLAGVSILFFWNHQSVDQQLIELRQFIIPMLMFIVPLIDTGTVVIRRLARRQSPFVGGKDHITHHLAYLGLSDRWVAILLLTLSLSSAALALWFFHIWRGWLPMHTFLGWLYFILVFVAMQIMYHFAQKKQAKKKALEHQKQAYV